MAQYQQLSIEEREKIQVGLWEKRSVRSIAKDLGRSPSTISRELNRNVPRERRCYVPRVAHQRTQVRIQKRGQRERLKYPEIREYVVQKLKQDYSPEQIAGTLPNQYPTQAISPEAIYQFIYAQYHRGGYGRCVGEDLRIYLKRHHIVRKHTSTPYPATTGAIKDRISIDVRPLVVTERRQLGHWEGDSMVSRKSQVGLNTLVERVSGLVCITKIKDSTAAETTRAVTTRLGVFPTALRQTLTLDNGHENAGHQSLTKDLSTKVFFAHPYHSWERGTNENTNGLIRYYLPKGTDFATVSDECISGIEYKLNTRPRKRLGWKTPLDIFTQGVALEC